MRKTILREKEADELAVNNAFDVCHVEERIAEFIDYLSDEIARQQVIINSKFTD
ncbi:TPA: hypothetical protein L7I91_003971 [Klebsiella aerogenes]|nr:hypothetical protein [Klebsiella aerogenes]HCB3009920.1 hypothetical protein [Klebsiella aerogenes]